MKRFANSVILTCSMLIAGCEVESDQPWQGYVEGEYVALAAPVAGRLQDLMVAKGDQVVRGELLFRLEPEPEQACLDEARGLLSQAVSTVANLEKGLRPSEIAAIEARLERARAEQKLAAIQFQRREELYATQSGTREAYDRTLTALTQAIQWMEEIEAELTTARLGGRKDEVEAARGAVVSAHAAVVRSEWVLQQKNLHSPENGEIIDTLYEPGEWVAAGRPVLTLLPPGNHIVRFYVPEPSLSTLSVGDSVVVGMDGRQAPLTANISFISPEAEYTPPVIYSSQSRAKLVFRVEARPDASESARFKPGQPIDVALTEDRLKPDASSLATRFTGWIKQVSNKQ